VRTATTTEEALAILEEAAIDVVITDLKGSAIGRPGPAAPSPRQCATRAVMVLTQYARSNRHSRPRGWARRTTSEAVHVAELRTKLERACVRWSSIRKTGCCGSNCVAGPVSAALIGTSAKMQKVYKLIERCHSINYSVLILGESGTGKELVARSIH